MVMCQGLDKSKINEKQEKEKSVKSEVNMLNFNKNPKIFLKTLKAKIISNNNKKKIFV